MLLFLLQEFKDLAPRIDCLDLKGELFSITRGFYFSSGQSRCFIPSVRLLLESWSQTRLGLLQARAGESLNPSKSRKVSTRGVSL